MKKSLLLPLLLLAFVGNSWGQTAPTAQSLPISTDFGVSAFTTLPAGYAAWNGLNGGSINSQTTAQNSAPTGDATIAASTGATSTGGSYGYMAAGNARFYIQTSGNSTNGANQLALAINTTGLQNITVTYDAEIINAQAKTIGLVCQYRVGTSGSWTTVAATGNPYSQAAGTVGVKATPFFVLPSNANNQAMVQIRWAVWRGAEAGNSSGIAVDNIAVSGVPAVGTPTPTNVALSNPSVISLDAAWTKPTGTYSTDWDGVVAFLSTSATWSPAALGDGVDYTADTAFMSGTGLTDGSSMAYCIANQTTDANGSLTISNLDTATTYYLYAYAYKTVAGDNDDDVFSTVETANKATYDVVAGSGVLFINEIMSDNDNFYPDNVGDYDDVIEIYNSSAMPINLAGYWISDGTNNYQILNTDSAATTVPANGFLVFFADSEIAEGANHLGFGLSSLGESVILRAPDNYTIIDNVVFPALALDVSYGRTPDGSSTFITFTLPSIGESNTAARLWVTSPNGGETFEYEQDAVITWTAANFSDDVNIALFKNGVFHAQIANNETNDGDYTWNVSDTLTVASDYAIVIEDAADAAPSDISNATFSIVALIPTLTVGDIAFVQFNSDAPDNFAFVALVDIEAGTEIIFTDNGWDGLTLTINENTGTWTATSPVLAGTVVTIRDSSNVALTTTGTMSAALSGLSASGDQVIAYQTKNSVNTYIAMVHFGTNNYTMTNSTNTNTSGLPTGLTDGTTAVQLGSLDNGRYNGTITSGDKTALLAAINNAANWETSNDLLLTYAGGNLTVPVELVAFTATATAQGVALNWETASEENNAYFEIERGADATRFEAIGKVAGAGTIYETQHYTFLDARPLNGVAYYRLRQIDYSGEFSYSPIVAVQTENKMAIALFPTQVTTQFNVVFPNDLTEKANVSIFSSNGQLLKNFTLTTTETQTINVQDLNAGIYFVKIQVANQVLTQRFVKL